ncbi:ankyrin [Tothia fuscella]|uniref:Ankyrin n=1 Tax=Tothia fuscella TaxID=1048955 RepID=A0A9P4P1E9_9PEZI|nr:ankyrin [Tothia fuscella]
MPSRWGTIHSAILLGDKVNEKSPVPDLAAQEGHFDVVHYLLASEQFSNEPELSSAIVCAAGQYKINRQEMVQLLVASGVSQHALNEALLALAALPPAERYGEDLIANQELEDLLATRTILLAAGSDAGFANSSTQGFTALHYLVLRKGVTAAMQLLLEHGASHNAKDCDDCTPVFHATFDYDDTDTVKLLVQAGANVSICNIDGRAPLHNAANFGSTPTFQYLLDHDAEPNITTKKWRSANSFCCAFMQR